MCEKIKALLRSKRQIEAELRVLRHLLHDDAYITNAAIGRRINSLALKLSLIGLCMSVLKEDEALIVQRHVIDGLNLPRLSAELEEKWGILSKTGRTYLKYQSNALRKIEAFIISQKETMGIDYEAFLA